MKATYGEITHNPETLANVSGFSLKTEPVVECREIFKDPITDDGTKKSAKGLLSVQQNSSEHKTKPNKIWLAHQQTWEEEKSGLLKTVFLNSKLVKTTTLEEIREKLK